ILVPVTGTAYSRHGAELALSLARADYGKVTALYVAAPAPRAWQREVRSALAMGRGGNAILREIVELGDRMGVGVRTAVRTSTDPAAAILNLARAGKHNLIVMGASPRPGETLFLGNVAAGILARSDRSVLFVSS